VSPYKIWAFMIGVRKMLKFVVHIFEARGWSVAERFVTTARFVTKVTKRAAMPARFVTNEVVTNRAGIAPFSLIWISVHVTLRVCVCVRACVRASKRETEGKREVREREI